MMIKKKEILHSLLKLVGIVFAATVLGKIFTELGFPETNIVVMYLLAVLLVARFTSGYQYGILSAVVSLICYNYFFTEPYHTLAVNDPGYLITFSIMLTTSILTSALTTKEKLLTEEANERGKESQILYMLSSKLSDAADMEAVLKIAAESISHLIQVNVGCIYVGRQSEPIYIQQSGKEQIHRSVPDADEIRKIYANLRTEYLEEEEAYGYPVNGREYLLAVVKIDKTVDVEHLQEKKKLLHSIMENVSMAMDRIEVTIERVRDRESMERERERANLLRAISHDLRTPLSGIMGTSEILMDMTDKEDRRQELLQGIYQDADWLKSLVENILSLTRLQDGKIVIQKEMEAIEEVIGCAVAHVERSFPEREIQVEIPDEFRLVPMDAKLIEQVITNLLDNAVKHTRPQETITVSAGYPEDTLLVSVRDEGEGIAEADVSNLFKIFYTSKTRSADVKRGIGLGLTICETVVNAHGGTITGRNRTDGKGAEFIFTLPLTEGGREIV
ncbi:MAG: DUF4118 domain-containing protein [Lachnospiraceae bacterium]|nr:DUF4118 domain-containing protein [Lachnospiraceae bacterium]